MDFVLGGMVLAHGAANIADQVFGWHLRGGAAALAGYALAGRQPAPLIAFNVAPRPLAVWTRPASPQGAQAAR